MPALSEEVRLAAREASEAARNERAGRLSAPGLAAVAARAGTPLPARAASNPSATAAASAAPLATATAAPAVRAAPAWAVSTRSLRTRFESEQMLAALRDVAYRNGHGNELKFEVMPTGDDWRAVGWPFASRAEAERLRIALAARGLKAEIVQF